MPKAVSEFLVDATTGLVKNFTGNYSVTPEIATLQPPADEIFIINSLVINIEDAGVFPAGGYGALSALTNGLTFRLQNDSGTIHNLSNGSPVKTNGEYTRFSPNTNYFAFGSGNNFLSVHHNFKSDYGVVILSGETSERFEVLLNDNFAGLEGHTFYVTGISLGYNNADLTWIKNTFGFNVNRA